jgi:Arc/MetJ-type ribon-helix-helix transcriptional regulator
MPRISATLPKDLVHILEGVVHVTDHTSKSEVVQEALAASFTDESKRVAAAYALFEADEIGAVEAFRLADVEDEALRAEFADMLDLDQASISDNDEGILSSIREGFRQQDEGF